MEPKIGSGPSVGSIVFSKAGRDKGKPFVVLRVEGDFVFLCDGKLRAADKPKKKKCKHIAVTNTVNELIAEKIKETGKVTSAEVRKALAAFVGANAEEQA